ncbi:MAG TPA: hypothetical protein DEG88_01740 [Propionibacteriaceae bacterium]|nr:hypothetical protein [Propionibacteriaceae bacterium]HBY22052.1 hypothetical protein [Propionibacteriaceae bacterium]
MSRLELPKNALNAIGDTFVLSGPIEELEPLATKTTISFTNDALAYTRVLLNEDSNPFQSIIGIWFKIPGSLISGVLGQVRSQLVDLVAELLVDNPLLELPGKAKVDEAVSLHIGTQYNTTIKASNGPMAIGTKAKATTQPSSLPEALKLLDEVRAAASSVGNDIARAELLDAIKVLELEARAESFASTGEIVKKAGRLRQLAETIGAPVLIAATSGAVEAFINLALAGAFG